MTQITLEQVRQTIRDKDIRMINLLSLDLIGRLHTLTLPVSHFDEALLTNGVGFDGSSYGYRKVEKSDMVLIPDLDSMKVDPFGDVPSLAFFSRIHLTDEERTRFSQDPRRVAEDATKALIETGVADQSLWGPEYEFYLFPK